MFDWLKRRLRSWLMTDAQPAGGKASRGQTLTDAFTGGGTIGGRTAMWSDWDTKKYHRSWVYSAVRAISNRVAAQGLRVGRRTSTASPPVGTTKAIGTGPTAGGKVRELPDHPLNELFDTPNPYLNEFSLLALAVASVQITGVSYLWYDEELDGVPRLWFLPSGWVRSDPDEDVPLTRFIVRPNASTEEFHLTSDELIRVATHDPSDPFTPLSPLRAAFQAVLCDGQIEASQLATFSNGGRPGLIVRVGRSSENSPLGEKDDAPALTRAQRKALTAMIREATSGAINDGNPVILDSFIKEIDRLTNTPAEMDFTDSSLLTRDRILAAFGVPKVILGMSDDANRASAVVSDEVFCGNTCAPVCRLLGDTLTAFFRSRFDDPRLVVWVPVPIPKDPDGHRANLQQLVGAGAITLDELRAEHGLDPLPGGAGTALVRAPAPTPPASGGTDPAGGGKAAGLLDLLTHRNGHQ